MEIAFGFLSFVQNSHKPVALSRAQSSIRVFILKILTNFGWGCKKSRLCVQHHGSQFCHILLPRSRQTIFLPVIEASPNLMSITCLVLRSSCQGIRGRHVPDFSLQSVQTECELFCQSDNYSHTISCLSDLQWQWL